MNSNDQIKSVRARLKQAHKVFVLTGAGISAESGIPTFRGPEGYWKNHSPQQLASPEGFARDPKLVWEWYNHRRRVIAGCEPNAAHRAVAEIERRAKQFLLCTQNVDGLHQRAGSRRVVEIHGSIWRTRPAAGGASFEDRTIYEENQLPVRAADGALLRPDVVWFGEALPAEAYARVDAFLASGPVDIAFVIGTSAVFPYIVRWAAIPRHQGGMVVEINPTPSLPEGIATVCFAAKAGDILPQLL
ncbi:MAG: NAD-dependent deacylase [Candidatus Sumerlaeia bacterium]|nr:NAD-dependent deacylase [Candidatus Sumerlaeia bacterium]